MPGVLRLLGLGLNLRYHCPMSRKKRPWNAGLKMPGLLDEPATVPKVMPERVVVGYSTSDFDGSKKAMSTQQEDQNFARETLDQLERFGRIARVAHQSRGPNYSMGLSHAMDHDLRVVGDCTVTFIDGREGLIYEVRVRQDVPGGHAVTFANLNTQGGRPVSITEIAMDCSTILVHCAAGGYYLYEDPVTLQTDAPSEAP